ncbi:sialate O-acetylesterase [Opitutus terrae]|uniref:Sialate O-acetylesterase domain-containing protein n=1 Tax=Opitutus terrae (strain DSM 11246 / JCM 15787 / PB90-1) TaxID=452637 RepID=B1ZRD5_OPITP|nr:sialate O-acetylesterase [Opitutus terrae]ACB74622.1 protein of unknown function DUF303 acetylesterase putative [Opitutus terrae PB90-1]
MRTPACLRPLGVALLLITNAPAAIQLASPFGDHMVLQQNVKLPVWGTAAPGEKVTVEFAGQQRSTTANAAGEWRMEFAPLPASAEPREFVVSSGDPKSKLETRKFHDVLVGEVWLCGGQSNMERQLGLRPGQKPIVGWEQEAAAAKHPLIRQLYVRQHLALEPQRTADMSWTVCSPDTVVDFTAVGYFFARDLHARLGVPIGIIHSSWGGTPAEAWTSREGLGKLPDFAELLSLLRVAGRDPAKARRHYEEQLDAWYRANDPGSAGASWADPAHDTTGWENLPCPGAWEQAGHDGFDGLVWLRRSFDLPANWNGGDVELRLSAIDDADTTWVNGQLVGRTGLYDLPRVYRVPGTALKRLDNVIAIRVLDTGGFGGIWDANLPLEVAPVDGAFTPVSLQGPWLARFAATLDDRPRPPQDPTAGPNAPTVLFNGMIAPLIPYAIRGAVFYQGESNADRARQYRTLFPAMIADWRDQWHRGRFPFLFVQIAPFKDQPPEIREAQLLAWQATKNTAMVVTIDVGDPDDIHPANKEPVGARLALAARALAYRENLEYSGPVFSACRIDVPRAVLSFSHIGGGLVAKDGPLVGFTIAGADGVFRPATATIVGETVVVTSPEVAKPTAVRYGWANVARGNLFNRAGLPASPFRTDVE